VVNDTFEELLLRRSCVRRLGGENRWWLVKVVGGKFSWSWRFLWLKPVGRNAMAKS
jgi:hypothetical protein